VWRLGALGNKSGETLLDLPRALLRRRSASTTLTTISTLTWEAVQRIELAQRQSHAVLLGQIGELGKRLDRMEAALQADKADRDERQRLLVGLLESIQRAASLRSGEPDDASSATLFRRRFASPAECARWLRGHGLGEVGGLLTDSAHPDRPVHVQVDHEGTDAVEIVRAGLTGLVHARRHVPERATLLWVLPPVAPDILADAALIHIVGILGGEATVHRSVGRRQLTAVLATRRAELIVPVVRWTAAALQQASYSPPVPSAGARMLAPAASAPAVVLAPQADREAAQQWAAPVIAGLLAPHGPGEATPAAWDWGVVWPKAALDDASPFLHALHALRDGLQPQGHRLTFQWVDGVPRIADTGRIGWLAAQAGVRLDLTPTVRAQTAAAFAAYDDREPYRPMAFDLRTPSFAAPAPGADDLVCLPRQDAVLVPVEPRPYDDLCRRRMRRLAGVLDHQRVSAFSLAVGEGRELAAAWEHHHIYNWKPPERLWARAVVIDGSAPAEPPATTGATQLQPSELLSLFADAQQAGTLQAAENVDLQIESHAYLANRLEPSADSARLASWLPDELGDTLEIGSGFGVLARALIGRARKFWGLDLTEAQAAAIAALGGTGLVGDIHRLPFPDAQLDTVIADNVLEHTLDPMQALRELRRVLKPGGRAYCAIPLDYLGPDYRNECHHWKADDRSIHAAFAEAGLAVVRSEICILPEIGSYGSFPSCDQRTSLWEVERPQPAAASRAP
jgi:SAM-dependent methyltransferase